MEPAPSSRVTSGTIILMPTQSYELVPILGSSHIAGRIERLKMRLTDINSNSSIPGLYKETLELLSHFKEEDIVSLANLLKQSLHFPELQRELALSLGDWYSNQTDLANMSLETRLIFHKNAMHYYVNAIQIDKLLSSPDSTYHQMASGLFIKLIRDIHGADDAFYEQLHFIANSCNPLAFEERCRQIDQYKVFCISEENYRKIIIEIFYWQANKALNKINETEKTKYELIRAEVESKQEISTYIPPKILPTLKYKQSLQALRKQFEDVQKMDAKEIRNFQIGAFKAYKQFFTLLLLDAFKMSGTRPSLCYFDIHAMGSIGRMEPCPFSDLELMILVKDISEKTLTYFKTLCHILDFQVRALGETSTHNLVFSCIHSKNPSGFHLDSGPHVYADLLNTPERMAATQRSETTDPASAENMLLKSSSLFKNDDDLAKSYEKAMISVLNENFDPDIS